MVCLCSAVGAADLAPEIAQRIRGLSYLPLLTLILHNSPVQHTHNALPPPSSTDSNSATHHLLCCHSQQASRGISRTGIMLPLMTRTHLALDSEALVVRRDV